MLINRTRTVLAATALSLALVAGCGTSGDDGNGRGRDDDRGQRQQHDRGVEGRQRGGRPERATRSSRSPGMPCAARDRCTSRAR